MLVVSLRGVNYRFGLRVFGTESRYICPFKFYLEPCLTKFFIKHPDTDQRERYQGDYQEPITRSEQLPF